MWKIEQTRTFRQSKKRRTKEKLISAEGMNKKNTVKILWTYNKSRISRTSNNNNNNIDEHGPVRRLVDHNNGIVWWNEYIRINWGERRECDAFNRSLANLNDAFEWSCVWLIYCDYFSFSVLHTFPILFMRFDVF